MDYSCHSLNSCLFFPSAAPTWQKQPQSSLHRCLLHDWAACTAAERCWSPVAPLTAVPPRRVSSLFHRHQSDLSIVNLIISPLCEILYGLLRVFRIKNPSSLVSEITFRDLASLSQSPTWSFESFLHVFCTPDMLTSWISLNVPCRFHATEHTLFLFPGKLCSLLPSVIDCRSFKIARGDLWRASDFSSSA